MWSVITLYVLLYDPCHCHGELYYADEIHGCAFGSYTYMDGARRHRSV